MRGKQDCEYCKGSGYVIIEYDPNWVRVVPVPGTAPDDPINKPHVGRRFTNVPCEYNGEGPKVFTNKVTK